MRPSLHRKLGIVLVAVLLLQLVGLSVVSAAPGPWGPAPGPVHFVRAGETLFAIGRLYGVNPWLIARANGLPNPHLIFVGQPLVVPVGPMPGPMGGPYPFPAGYNPGGPGGQGMVHMVMRGETLFAIGRLYGVNPWAIAAANQLPNPHLIFIGQVLCIPGPGPAFVM